MLEGLGIPSRDHPGRRPWVSGLTQGGRSIPAQVFFASEDEFAALFMQCAVNQVAKPLVAVNFGMRHVRSFKVKMQSLAEQAKSDASAADMLQEPDSRQAMGGGLSTPKAPKPPGPGGGRPSPSRLRPATWGA
jgi:hypothetical protein